MIGRIEAAARRTAFAKRPWPVIALAVVATCVLFALAAPNFFTGATLRREIAEQIRVTTGLALRTDDASRFSLWPQPHVAMARLHLADSSGTLAIDADGLDGEVRLLPLLVGRVEIASATLDHPRLRINIDGQPMPADSMIGRALRSLDGPGASDSQRLGIVTLVDGTAAITGKALGRDALMTGINVVVDWRNLDAPATLTGSVEYRGAPTDVAAWIAQPSSLLRGDHSPIALRLQSVPLNLSANGDLASAPSLRFHGRVSVDSPSLASALSLAGQAAALPAPFANLVMSGEVAIGDGDLDLTSLRLRLDGNQYEGTLAYRSGEKPSLAGTLAGEQLSLAPFLASGPPLLDADRRWSRQPIRFDPGHLALDLRVSASRLRLLSVTIDDAALAVMTRDDRVEVALAGGQAYGGAVKARASIGASEKGLSLRATGSIADADASALSWDALGRQVAAGMLSLSVNLESAGDSPASLMAALRGSAKGRVSDGELSGVDLGEGLHEIALNHLDALLPALRNGRTLFKTLDCGLRLAGGVATVENGALQGPDVTLALTGRADVARRQLDLRSLVTPRVAAKPDGGEPHLPTPRLSLAITGSVDQPVVMPDLSPVPPDPAKP